MTQNRHKKHNCYRVSHDTTATQLRHKCDTNATQVRHNCDTSATQMRHNCDTRGTQFNILFFELIKNSSLNDFILFKIKVMC